MEELTQGQIHYIAESTRGQRDNPLWHEMRRCRLTSSNFGLVLTALSSKRRMDYRLRAKLLGMEDIDYIDPIRWGIEHEKEALESYVARTQHKVKATGLWLFPEGYFGASPDGLVYEKDEFVGIVEVKCPWKLHDTKIQHEEDWAKRLDYIAPPLLLSKTHPYYHQVQGELAATGATWCDFFVWSPQQVLTLRVLPDKSWQETLLPQIKRYYKEKILRPEDHSLILTYSQMIERLNSNAPLSRFNLASILRPNTSDEHHFSHAISFSFLLHMLGWVDSFTGGRRAPPKDLPRLLTQARKHSCLTCIRSLFLKRYPEFASNVNLLSLDLLKSRDLYASIKRNAEITLFVTSTPPCTCSK